MSRQRSLWIGLLLWALALSACTLVIIPGTHSSLPPVVVNLPINIQNPGTPTIQNPTLTRTPNGLTSTPISTEDPTPTREEPHHICARPDRNTNLRGYAEITPQNIVRVVIKDETVHVVRNTMNVEENWLYVEDLLGNFGWMWRDFLVLNEDEVC